MFSFLGIVFGKPKSSKFLKVSFILGTLRLFLYSEIIFLTLLLFCWLGESRKLVGALPVVFSITLKSSNRQWNSFYLVINNFIFIINQNMIIMMKVLVREEEFDCMQNCLLVAIFLEETNLKNCFLRLFS